ncbi:hypothetical protein HK105_203561 [Polyrhizophydium stewartii]|uniref:G-protein coupled receptors family 3 profile domain-containing protein n=1 Tax=Polyrhizophydium stewartii TaxID=2732419 RepID=A0ABR4NB73_9FUNG
MPPILACALALFASVATVWAGPANKAATTLSIAVLDDNLMTLSDQYFMGARMAAAEANANTSILPDATLNVSHVMLKPFLDGQAAFYDVAVNLCDHGGHHAFFFNTKDVAAVAVGLMPSFSTMAYDPDLQDKHLFPLFHRPVNSVSQDISILIAQFKFFGWTRAGLLISENKLWTKVSGLILHAFPQHGIAVLSRVQMPTYNPQVSKLYYPQIRTTFEFLKSTRLRIFIALLNIGQAPDVMMAANRTGIVGRDYVWLLDTPEFHDASVASRWDTPWDPMLLRGVGFPFFDTTPLFDDPYFTDWMPRFVHFTTETIANEPQLYPTLDINQTDPTQQSHPASFAYDDPGDNTTPSLFVRYGYESAMRFSLAVHKLVSDMNSSTNAFANRSILPAMTLARLTAPFQGTRPLTRVVQFTALGDPLPEAFTWQMFDGMSQVGEYGATVATVVIDMASGVATFTPDPKVFMWAGDRPLSNVPRDFPRMIDDFVAPRRTGTIAMLAMSFVIIIACLVVAALIAWHSGKEHMRPHSPMLLALMMVGLALLQLQGLTIVGRENTLGCRLRLWPAVLGITLVLASMLHRGAMLVGTLSAALYPNAPWVRHFGTIKGVALVLAPCVLTIILLVILTIAAPMTSTSVYIESFDGYRFVCDSTPATSALTWAIMALLAVQLISALVLALGGRTIPGVFNTTLHVFASVLVIVVLSGVCVLQGSNPTSMQTQFYFESVCAAVGAVLIFVVMVVARIGRTLGKLTLGKLMRRDQPSPVRQMTLIGSLETLSTSMPGLSFLASHHRLAGSRAHLDAGRAKSHAGGLHASHSWDSVKHDYDITLETKTPTVDEAIKAMRSLIVISGDSCSVDRTAVACSRN